MKNLILTLEYDMGDYSDVEDEDLKAFTDPHDTGVQESFYQSGADIVDMKIVGVRIEEIHCENTYINTPFSIRNLPEGTWRFYKKIRSTEAIRILEPFTVETKEGTLTCKDGYLALDSEGYPYPIEFKEFKEIYKEE